MGKAFIGTSGWQYPHWVSKFYPLKLPQKEWLGYYGQYFDTVEVNATFYHQMKAETFQKWRETVGHDFTFAIKGSRFITHVKRLKDCPEAGERFIESASGLLGKAERSAFQPATQVSSFQAFGHSTQAFSQGGLRVALEKGAAHLLRRNKHVILWQLPPGMKADLERLNKFLKILPKTFRHAFEFRHKSWLNPEIYSLLKEHNAALVIQDSPSWPTAEVVTSDFVYLRFHGKESLYASCYSEIELDFWSKKMKQWLGQGLDVYGYFNNDAEGYAVENARTLENKLL